MHRAMHGPSCRAVRVVIVTTRSVISTGLYFERTHYFALLGSNLCLQYHHHSQSLPQNLLLLLHLPLHSDGRVLSQWRLSPGLERVLVQF